VIDPDFHSELPSINWAHHGEQYSHMYTNSGRVVGPPNWSPMQDVVKITLPPMAGVRSAFSQSDVVRDVWSPGRDCYAQVGDVSCNNSRISYI
jgi:hypothetical protein